MAYEKELKIGAQIAREAGILALKIREGTLGIEIKADESPVTVADRACEKLIVEGLSAAFPEDGLLGEEGAMRQIGERQALLDPAAQDEVDARPAARGQPPAIGGGPLGVIDLRHEEHQLRGLVARIVGAVAEMHPGAPQRARAPLDGRPHRLAGHGRGCRMG